MTATVAGHYRCGHTQTPKKKGQSKNSGLPHREFCSYLKYFHHISLKAKLHDVSKQLDYIVSAVSQGFTQASFLEKMTELEEQKNTLSFSIQGLEMDNKKTVITEDILRQLFGMFKSNVAEKNIPEIKKFIGSYVEKVIVYKEHVDVIL
ncbi:hypothetical protein [Brevibacillus fluminis]|uniref:hypothetical protein n=1 Tax=Brevibacillus fluminis TaxID=511487 RepID=UPI0011CD68BC|nr:hypothetical protein [Brevibacillus fluminis]